MKQYYIVSLKHTSKGDTALTFWCANGAGYTYSKNRAGVYEENKLHQYTTEDNVAVEKEKVDKFWMNALDFDDKFVAVPNNSTVRYHLGLSDKFMKPIKHKTCKMVFINTPVESPL